MTYDVWLHDANDGQSVLAWLDKQRVNVGGASGRKIRIYVLEDSAILNDINALPAVAKLEEYITPKLHNDVARQLLGIDDTNPNPGAVIAETGDGQIVGVADTGLDDSHPDFQGRIAGVVALGRPNDSTDPHGHGTHVSGSILGDGAASGGKIRGAAPGAQLFFQSILDARGELGGLPLNLSDLFDEAYQAGARIHNNSWGGAVPGTYTVNSIEVDEYVANHRDMLIVISAGNDGQAVNRLHSPQGFVDWLSVGTPATAKNALTVGASRSSRTDGAFSGLTYGQAWPGDYPDPPIAAENVSGNPECLAAFSSRGPCDDRRIKPDVVAPGTDIASTKSSRAPLTHFWGAYPGNPKYAFMGGTSMSAPLVSGCAALVREYYVKTRKAAPSAALVKGTLLNGTRWLGGADALADSNKLANFHQGFGCINMPTTLPNGSKPNLKLEFVDSWQDNQMQFVRTGQRFRFNFSIAAGGELRLCLTWTDYPGRSLQNNLNLFLQNLQTREKWTGNPGMALALLAADADNNVEVIRLDDAPAGDYLIQVAAENLLHTPQDFALVVTGNLTTALQPF